MPTGDKLFNNEKTVLEVVLYEATAAGTGAWIRVPPELGLVEFVVARNVAGDLMTETDAVYQMFAAFGDTVPPASQVATKIAELTSGTTDTTVSSTTLVGVAVQTLPISWIRVIKVAGAVPVASKVLGYFSRNIL